MELFVPTEEILSDPAAPRYLVGRRISPERQAKMNRRIALFPIIVFQIYLAASVLTFAFGPWQWPVSNPWQLYTFLALAHGALLAGYLKGIKNLPRRSSTGFRVPVPVAVTVSLVLNFLWIGQTYKFKSSQAFDLEEFVAAAATGFTDPGQRYDEKVKAYLLSAGRDSTTQDYISLLLFPLLWIAFPLGVFFWKQLSIQVRVALIAWTIFDLSTWVAAGTNKGIADFVLLLPSLLVAQKPSMLANLRLRKVGVAGLVAILGVAVLLIFFSLGMVGRSGGKLLLRTDPATGVGTDPDSFALRYLPAEMEGPMASLLSYFSGGYYGLSLTLQEPFVFCYGVGNSYFLEGLSRHLVSTRIMNDTYPARIDVRSWDLYGKWHSLYPWIASDISFPGTIIFMFVVGWLFGLVWIDVAFCRNPLAVCLFALFLIMLFYIPANNQVLAFAPTALPFWTLLPLWFFSRDRREGKRRGITAS
jgi:hypothetical protein